MRRECLCEGPRDGVSEHAAERGGGGGRGRKRDGEGEGEGGRGGGEENGLQPVVLVKWLVKSRGWSSCTGQVEEGGGEENRLHPVDLV